HQQQQQEGEGVWHCNTCLAQSPLARNECAKCGRGRPKPNNADEQTARAGLRGSTSVPPFPRSSSSAAAPSSSDGPSASPFCYFGEEEAGAEQEAFSLAFCCLVCAKCLGELPGAQARAKTKATATAAAAPEQPNEGESA